MRFLAIAFLALMSLPVIASCQRESPFQTIPQNISAVRITGSTPGHGSAVHLGNGYLLSAAHVVGSETVMTVHFADRSIAKADVMWSNKAKDIALLRFEDTGRVQSSPLACRVASPGEHVTAIGNPMWLGQLAFEGRINGPVTDLDGRKYLPADLTVLPGMSGGGVLDDEGNVIGIAVAFPVAPVGMFPSWARVGLLVDGRTICELLARA